LDRIFAFTREFFDAEAIEEQHRFPVNFAVEEIFTNWVKYNPDNSNEILIQLARHDNRLRIVMQDFDVEPFDVTRAPQPDTDAALEDRTVGGLGIFLTHKVMDHVEYHYEDRSSKVTLTRSLG
jgi:serine/threonine-protein kinase RsbW